MDDSDWCPDAGQLTFINSVLPGLRRNKPTATSMAIACDLAVEYKRTFGLDIEHQYPPLNVSRELCEEIE
jgi:hypothetical protein